MTPIRFSNLKLRLIAQLGLFQLGWFICILGEYGAVLTYTAIVIFIYYFWLFQSPKEWIYAARIAVIGWSMDSCLMLSNVFILSDGTRVIPYWLACLWVIFALSLRGCFAFLKGRLMLASLLGALGGGFSYYGGAQLSNDIAFAQPLFLNVSVIAVIWALFMPFAVFTVFGGISGEKT